MQQKILSIVGGGIRGVIPICALIEMERQTGMLVRQIYADGWVAGTSTGADITALIEAGIPMKDALSFYTGKLAHDVFSPRGVAADLKQVAEGYKYDPGILHDALSSALGQNATMTINNCPTRVLITAVDMRKHVWFFARDNALNGATTGECSLIDAAVASSCAPTYHDYWQVQIGAKKLWMADGGIGCFGNPGHQACIEAFVYDEGFDPVRTQAVCLGTGFYVPPENEAETKIHGLLNNVKFAVGSLTNSAEDLMDLNARREYFWDFPAQYQKLNVQLPRDISEDDLGSIPDLVALGHKWAAGIDWLSILKN